LPKETLSDYINDAQTSVLLRMFLSTLRLKKGMLSIFYGFLLKRVHQYPSVTQTDITGFLVINKGELERNKFGLTA